MNLHAACFLNFAYETVFHRIRHAGVQCGDVPYDLNFVKVPRNSRHESVVHKNLQRLKHQ